MTGPDTTAQNYEALLGSRLRGGAQPAAARAQDPTIATGSFSNLRMAWQDAEREYGRRRLWWHRHYRLPLWRALLSDAFADGRLPRMSNRHHGGPEATEMVRPAARSATTGKASASLGAVDRQRHLHACPGARKTGELTMKKSVKLTLRASEIRSEINRLDPGEETLAKRRELLASLDTVETEYRAELTAEAEAESTAPDANGLTPEEREFRQLESRAELRHAFHAVMSGSHRSPAPKRSYKSIAAFPVIQSAVGYDRPARPAPDGRSRRRGIGRPVRLPISNRPASSVACSPVRRPWRCMSQYPIGRQRRTELSDRNHHDRHGEDSRQGRGRRRHGGRRYHGACHYRAEVRLQRSAICSGARIKRFLSGLEEALRADLIRRNFRFA